MLEKVGGDMAIKEMFGIEHPILQAPMAGASTAELVAAVSNAGGLGALGAATFKPDALRAQVHAIRQQTDRPFNINLFAPVVEQYDPALTPGAKLSGLIQQYHDELALGEVPKMGAVSGPVEEQLQVLIEEKVPVISFHFGIEKAHVDAIHAIGSKVLCTATNVAEAKYLQEVGVDAVIAQGAEAGGHRGTFLGFNHDSLVGTFALVPAIVDAIDLPVIAAGGIMDARGIVAARALGADAVQMGTAFLGCPEAGIADAWTDSLLDADAINTTVTSAMSGRPARGIRNRYISEVEETGELLPYPQQYSLSKKLRPAASKTNNADFMAMWSGQGVSALRQIPAADLVAELVREVDAFKL